jgi:hypothetical protein
MKIRQPIVFICALGILLFLATGVFSDSSPEADPQSRRGRSIVKFFRDREQKGPLEWPFSAGRQSSGHFATTLFKVLTSSAPDLFETGKHESGGTNTNPRWIDLQVKSMTADAVLDQVVKELSLAEDWGMTSAAAAEKLRGMMTVSRQEETDVVAITVRHSDPAKAAELANAVREAYVARRESVETERIRRLIANTEAQIEKLAAELEKSPPEDRKPPENQGYARGMVSYESQRLLLNTIREHHMRINADTIVVREPVEILEIAKPGPSN